MGDEEYEAWIAKMAKLAEASGDGLPDSFRQLLEETPGLTGFMGNYVLDEKHQPREVPLIEYILWKAAHRPEMIVAQDSASGYEVSTVFLGLDGGMRFGDDPNYRPILFETMVFVAGEEVAQRRWYTWDQAEREHAIILAEVRKAVNG